MKSNKKLLFSDFFKVDSQILHNYGAYNISLIADTKLFINPILLFASKDRLQKETHKKMVKYLALLYVKSKSYLSRQELIELFTFKEPKQNWFGYTLYGNAGRGLGIYFATELYGKLKKSKLDFDQNSHPEQIFLFGEGHGPDSISDFTVRLIFDYLLEFTQEFSLTYLKESQLCKIKIRKSMFDFEKEKWITKTYKLPCYNNDYIILTPSNIVMNVDSYINFNEFIDNFEYYVNKQSDVVKYEVNMHLSEQMYEELKSRKDKRKVIDKVIDLYPSIIKSYINDKVENKDIAIQKNINFVEHSIIVQDLMVHSINSLEKDTNFYSINSSSLNGCIQKTQVLKEYIEDNIKDFKEIKKLDNHEIISVFSKIWYSGKPKSKSMYNDKVEFIVSRRSHMEKVLKGRFIDSYELENSLCYIVKSNDDMKKLNSVFNNLNLVKKEGLTIIKLYNN